MELHGENPKQNVIAVIPARYKSTRLEGKLLLPISGKPLILHTLEQAKQASCVSRVIVATDDKRIFDVVQEHGDEAVMTSPKHESGSDRIAEVSARLPEGTIVVNVQGDEPLISPRIIEVGVEALLSNETADMATTCEKITDYREVLDPNIVKVVSNSNGYAQYFSRSPIPFPRESVSKFGSLENALLEMPDLLKLFRKHTGLYVYRREFLLAFTRLKQTILEKTEMLEQLRALENGATIKVVDVNESSISVDTQEDFEKVQAIFSRRDSVIYKPYE